jgi:hypothetical protein
MSLRRMMLYSSWPSLPARTQAAFTNGTNQCFIFPNGDTVQSAGTIEFRAKIMNDGRDTGLAQWATSVTPHDGDPKFYYNIQGNSLYRGFSQGYTPSISYTNNIWAHFAIRYNGQIIEFLQNGSVMATQTGPPRVSNAGIYLGSGYAGFSIAQFADLRIWTVLRTNQQILDNKDKSIGRPQPGLAANYLLDGNLNDISGNDYQGTAVNGASFVSY